MKYLIYDENKELMRKTKTYAEAKEICKLRKGWIIKRVKVEKIVYEDAPF
jgi:hypothetical protein